MDLKKPNKIREIVRLQQLLKKWKNLATAPKNSTNSSKSVRFLKKTLSFNDSNAVSEISSVVPKGFLAVCVGKDQKRFIIPTEYLSHAAFKALLREAEEEFGFEQEGVLRIPCEVSIFEKILKVVEEKREVFFMQDFGFSVEKELTGCCSSQSELAQSHHPHESMLSR